MNKVKSFFLKSGERSIFCTLIGDTSKVTSYTIIFLPLFEERMWSQRIAYNFAHNMSETGQLVLMWDYYGYGESDGDSEDFSLKYCIDDIRTIINYMISEYCISTYNFLGIRTGCCIAFHIILDNNFVVNKLVLWAPITDIKAYVFKALRSTISTQSYVFKKIVANRDTILEELLKNGNCIRDGYILNHIDGYRIGKLFYEEIVITKVGLPINEELPILYLDIVPADKEGLKNKIAEEKQKSLVNQKNVLYHIETEREFWLNCLDYSQISDNLNSLTVQWLQ